jgi:hypothetical protein
MIRRTAFAALLLSVSVFGQSIEQFSGTVVFLRTLQNQSYATGFLVTPDERTMVLVTAEHVALLMKSAFRATIRGENDTPIDLSSEELTGSKTVNWVAHGTEDIAVTVLHPSSDVISKLQHHFMVAKAIDSGHDAPSRERLLTTVGFPLALGVNNGHFSPISRDSKPASGLVTLPRFDTHTLATFYLLDSPSIGGFSGAPVFLFPFPYGKSSGALAFPIPGAPTSEPRCIGLIHGTISDDTGGKMAAVTPSVYIVETIAKATGTPGH